MEVLREVGLHVWGQCRHLPDKACFRPGCPWGGCTSREADEGEDAINRAKPAEHLQLVQHANVANSWRLLYGGRSFAEKSCSSRVCGPAAARL